MSERMQRKEKNKEMFLKKNNNKKSVEDQVGMMGGNSVREDCEF